MGRLSRGPRTTPQHAATSLILARQCARICRESGALRFALSHAVPVKSTPPHPTRHDVEGKFAELIAGEVSRHEVDRWAAQWVAAEHSDVDDGVVWCALTKLCGIDLTHGRGEPYLHDDEQLIDWLREFRDRAAR